jgi:hypothetical protein
VLKTGGGMLLFFNLQWVTKGSGFDNLLIKLIKYSPTTLEDCLIGISLTLVCFGVEGVIVFNGLKMIYYPISRETSPICH